MGFARIAALSCLIGAAISKPAPKLHLARQASATASSAQPLPTTCGDIITQADVNGSYVFSASAAYECLASVPFNDAVALRFVDYYNQTMQFQSTLAYLKNPPEGYQQPAVDLEAGLAAIKQNITAGYYKNQYAFEAEVQKLVYSVHDMHVDLWGGILSAFSFGSSYELVSVSKDGKAPPQIYLTGDVLYYDDPQPISAINGQDPIEYLTKFAALNSQGTLEPHADWNQLMSSPALDIQGSYNVFSGGATFYPGDKLTFSWTGEDDLETDWLALYTNPSPTGPLTTGGDFYNYFVLGLTPASYNESDYSDAGDGGDEDASTVDTDSNWYNASYGAYPANPDVVQADLSSTGGGIVTGYFLNESSIGVLSIPSFDMYGDYVGGFSNATVDFINRAQNLNLSRIVIDLQQNQGGQSLLAYDLFKRFFPSVDPYSGSRRRIFPMANVLGETTTNFWDNLEPGTDDYENYYELLAADEWLVTDRLNADTGVNFTSWEEYAGPHTANGDTFSLTEKYNITSPVFSWAAFDGWQLADDYSAPTPWAPENIVLLTDGICSSTCAIFAEMMTQQGVRTVVAGGRPDEPGPMQAVAGTRGAISYSAGEIDTDISWVLDVDNSTAGALPAVRDPGIATISFAGFNLRDQVRRGEDTPLQFQYQAAHCRIYFTLANVYNTTRLWLDAAAAVFDDNSLCVAGSTGFATTGNGTAAQKPPPVRSAASGPVPINALVQDLDINTDANAPPPPLAGLEAGIGADAAGIEVCPARGCDARFKAVQKVGINCGGPQPVYTCVCLPKCDCSVGGATSCPGSLTCKSCSAVPSKQLSAKTTTRSPSLNVGAKGASSGTCKPSHTLLAGSRKLCGSAWRG